MNWDDLKVVAAVRDAGTFARAGRALGIDETTVARRLERLQAALGVRLFDTVDGLRKPTPHCERLFDHLRDIERAAADISEIAESPMRPARTIRLAATASIAEDVLAPHVGAFLAIHPDLCLEIATSSENVDFSRWQADLAIRLGKPEKGAFAIRKLAKLSYSLVKPKSARVSSDEGFVCAYPEDLAHTAEMRDLAAADLPEPVRLVTGNLRVIRSALRSGHGIGVLPQHLARDFLDDSRFEVTPMKTPREVWLLIQPHLKDDPDLRAVIAWVVERFADPDAL